jgi:hypothetical protein
MTADRLRASAPSPMLHGLLRNADFWACYENLQLTRTAKADRPFIETGGASRIFDVRFSPNRVDFSLAAGRDATVVRLNQNAAPGWISSLADVVAEDIAGMRAPLEPGQAGKYFFRFTPPGFYAGLATAVLALLASVAVRARQLPDR